MTKEVPILYRDHQLHTRVAEADAASGQWMLFLNGAGAGIAKERFIRFHEEFFDAGINSISFDYVGTGQTGGDLSSSSLQDRIDQVLGVIDYIQSTYGSIRKLGVYGVSMGCYVALGVDHAVRDSGKGFVQKLMLAAGAAYAADAHNVHFGPQFTEILRSLPDGRPSWVNSLSFGWIAKSRADVMLVVAEHDEIVPREISDKYRSIAEARPVGKFVYHLIPGATHYIGRNGQEAELAPELVTFF